MRFIAQHGPGGASSKGDTPLSAPRLIALIAERHKRRGVSPAGANGAWMKGAEELRSHGLTLRHHLATFHSAQQGSLVQLKASIGIYTGCRLYFWVSRTQASPDGRPVQQT